MARFKDDVLTLAGYDEDFFLWTQQQAALMRERNDGTLDWVNLAEEIESLGKSDRRAIDSQLERLLVHLLKWEFQSDAWSASRRGSIQERRRQMERIIEDSPSLKSRPAEVLTKVYSDARRKAIDEIGLISNRAIPTVCHYDVVDILDPDWAPGGELGIAEFRRRWSE